jgi:hypothetical protein
MTSAAPLPPPTEAERRVLRRCTDDLLLVGGFLAAVGGALPYLALRGRPQLARPAAALGAALGLGTGAVAASDACAARLRELPDSPLASRLPGGKAAPPPPAEGGAGGEPADEPAPAAPQPTSLFGPWDEEAAAVREGRQGREAVTTFQALREQHRAALRAKLAAKAAEGAIANANARARDPQP